MKLLVDACVPAEWVGFLLTHGHDCESWLQVGAPNAPDAEIRRGAFADNRIVLNNDLDFGRLLAFSRSTHPTVIQFRAIDIRPAAIGAAIL
jgi:predicted nuclease of predicted toxin-antitoxin system